MKICLYCKHFDLDMGEPGYSENTPGYSAYICCNMSLSDNPLAWSMSTYGNVQKFRAALLAAEICNFFEYSDDMFMHIQKTRKAYTQKSYCGMTEKSGKLYTREQIDELLKNKTELIICPTCLSKESKSNVK